MDNCFPFVYLTGTNGGVVIILSGPGSRSEFGMTLEPAPLSRMAVQRWVDFDDAPSSAYNL